MKLLFTNANILHNTNTGIISRAQKYTIKCNKPYVFAKKIVQYLYSSRIFTKTTKISVYNKRSGMESSK